MTTLPETSAKKLGLVIDLDTCVGCHACVVSCKGWNTENYGAALSDQDPYGADPSGTFLNRVHSYEVQPETGPAQLIHFPKSCLHCEDAPCVTVCPTGASYKRSEDGIVLVNEDACIGCGLCAWACPYGESIAIYFENTNTQLGAGVASITSLKRRPRSRQITSDE